MARLRTFIAIDAGQQIRDRLVALQETLTRPEYEVKWVEPDNLHVTLLFLGEVDMRTIPAVCKVVAAACADLDTFPLSVETVGCFPNARRPRVVWAGVTEGHQELCALHDRLEEPLLDLGCYRREGRQYTPHITLGRVKSDDPTEKLAAALTKQANWRGGSVAIREVHVMSSELTRGGPTYTILGRGKLK